MNKTLKQRIESLVKDAKKVSDDLHKNPCSRDAFMRFHAEQERLGDEYTAIDRDAGKGVVVGRTLNFFVADSYACYLITKVRKSEVVVAHVPLGDGYTFAGVYQNAKGETVLPRQVVDTRLSLDDNFQRA
jgi:hypothetical protein